MTEWNIHAELGVLLALNVANPYPKQVIVLVSDEFFPGDGGSYAGRITKVKREKFTMYGGRMYLLDERDDLVDDVAHNVSIVEDREVSGEEAESIIDGMDWEEAIFVSVEP